jgi:hypothetical protein
MLITSFSVTGVSNKMRAVYWKAVIFMLITSFSVTGVSNKMRASVLLIELDGNSTFVMGWTLFYSPFFVGESCVDLAQGIYVMVIIIRIKTDIHC